MLTGRPAFAGETVSDTIAAILEREPDWDVAAAPRRRRPFARLLGAASQKDPKRRLRDIGDARLEIEERAARGRRRDAPGAPPRRSPRPTAACPGHWRRRGRPGCRCWRLRARGHRVIVPLTAPRAAERRARRGRSLVTDAVRPAPPRSSHPTARPSCSSGSEHRQRARSTCGASTSWMPRRWPGTDGPTARSSPPMASGLGSSPTPS